MLEPSDGLCIVERMNPKQDEVEECIFEKYGMKAKQFDYLTSAAAQRNLTTGENAFRLAFADMIYGDATEEQMNAAHAEWMNENVGTS